MNTADFEEIAWKAVMGEATREETTSLQQACKNDPILKAQWDQLRADYAQATEVLQTWRAVQTSNQRAAPTAEVMDRLMARVIPAAPGEAVSRPSKAWWQQANTAIMLGLAASVIAAFIVWLARVPTSKFSDDIASAPPSGMASPLASNQPDGTRNRASNQSPANVTRNAPALQPGKQKLNADLTPIGTTQFLDPLLAWADASPAGDRLTITLVGQGELTTIAKARSPLSLISALAAAGQQPQPGATYVVNLEGAFPRSWTFTIDPAADVFPSPMNDTALLTAAESATNQGDVLQYLVRLSPSARDTARARQIESSLRTTRVR